MVILSKKDKSDSEYPSFLNDLLDIYDDKSESKLIFWHIPILLNQGNYKKALEYIPEYIALATSKKTNASFRQFLTDYCNRQLEET
jgi:hypothetical protein